MQRLEREMSTSRFGGFTLIEVMITVAVIAILAAVALPSYIDYLTRGKLVEAKTDLSDMRTRLEQFYLDYRKYPTNCVNAGATATPGVDINKPPDTDTDAKKYFKVTCALAADTYTITATSTALGFAFTIDQTNLKTTSTVPAGWRQPSPNTCWVSRKNGDC